MLREKNVLVVQKKKNFFRIKSTFRQFIEIFTSWQLIQWLWSHSKVLFVFIISRNLNITSEKEAKTSLCVTRFSNLIQYLPVFGVKCSEHRVLLQLKLLILWLLWGLLFLLQLLEGGRCASVSPLDVSLKPSSYGLYLDLQRGWGRTSRWENPNQDNNKEPDWN